MLRGKNIIVTGARKGIGYACVELFTNMGANVWACVRTEDEEFKKKILNLEQKNGVNIWPVIFDLEDESSVKSAIALIKKSNCQIDGLANIAGAVADSKSFAMTPIEQMKHVFDVNFFGLTLFTQYVSRLMMRQKNGSIVNVASIAGIDGTPAQYEYAGSKAALIGATRNLFRELAQYGIRVNSVAPGIVDTDMSKNIENELKDTILDRVALRRMGNPEEIASVIAFLLSDMSSYVNGQVIRVDGGM